MNRAVPHRLGLFLLAGTLLVLAGTAWGAAVRTHSRAPHAAPVAKIVQVKHATSHSSVARVARHKAPARVTSVPAIVHPAPVAGSAGMRIFRDPETGEVGPPTTENAAIMAREAEPPVDVTNIPQVRLPNGGWELLLDGLIEDAAVVQIDANGNRVVRCVNDPKTALKQAPPVPPAPVREDR